MNSSIARPYATYWSTYTDLRGRNQFRNLYWDKFKDLIGRPAKLVGIERERLWPSGKPSHGIQPTRYADAHQVLGFQARYSGSNSDRS